MIGNMFSVWTLIVPFCIVIVKLRLNWLMDIKPSAIAVIYDKMTGLRAGFFFTFLPCVK